MDKATELLEKCAEVFEKMDDIYWRDDSAWNESCYCAVSNEVSNFLNDLEKLEPCPKCKKPRGLDEHGAFICPCPHCGCVIPF